LRQLDIYIDGAAKGNPGPAGIGVVILQDGRVLKNISRFIGNKTNNVAEYTALIYGLQEALILLADKKIAFPPLAESAVGVIGDNSKRFSVVGKVPYTFPDHKIRVWTDSELISKQLKGEYRVRHENLKPLFEQIKHLTGGFGSFEIHHISRERNRGADKLANQAVKESKIRRQA